MFTLDTNAVSDFFHRKPTIVQRAEQAIRERKPIHITTITRYEVLMRGRYQAILAAEDRDRLLTAHQRLLDDEIAIRQFPILGLDDASADHFERLRTAKGMRKIGRADLLIACITLAHDATLVTRNVKDFVKIPNLKIENGAK